MLYNKDAKLVYDGDWHEGLYENYGTLYNYLYKEFVDSIDFEDMDKVNVSMWKKYEGDFQRGLKNGFGIWYFSNEEKFAGILDLFL